MTLSFYGCDWFKTFLTSTIMKRFYLSAVSSVCLLLTNVTDNAGGVIKIDKNEPS